MIEIVANEQTSSNSQFLSEYTGNSVLEKMLKEKRIIFPLTDFDGNVTGFSGRNLSTNPKYKNLKLLLQFAIYCFSDSDNYGLRLAKRIVSLLHSKQIKAAVYSTDMALDLDDFFAKDTRLMK